MAEPKFIPKPGQIDFTSARYAPVINTVVVKGDEILLLRRSKDLQLYPAYWNGVSGFLDDKKGIEQKVSEEFQEELGMEESKFKVLKIGRPFLQEAPEYGKTWLVVPVHVSMGSNEFKLDWESQEARWFKFHQLNSIRLMPGYQNLIKEFYPNFNL